MIYVDGNYTDGEILQAAELLHQPVQRRTLKKKGPKGPAR